MSITDATTSLGTTWTEQSTVDFLSGTLSTITSCVTEVESKLKRGTLSSSSTPTSTQVQNWLIRAKEELAEIKGFTFKRRYAYASLTSGTYRYSLPPDYNGGRLSIRDTSNDFKIDVVPEDYFDTKYPDPSAEDNDEPLVATIKNMELWFAPPPNGAYTVEIEYERSGADNTTTDFSWLPEIERFRCCDFAAAEAFESLHMWEVSDRYRAKWNAGLGKAIRADGKRKWKTMNYQVPNWFLDYQNRYNQS